MAQPQLSPPPGRPRADSLAPVVAFLLSLGWLIAVLALVAPALRQGQPLPEILVQIGIVLAIALPVVLMWVAALLWQGAQALTDLDARVAALAVPAPVPAPPPPQPHTAADALALFVSRREAALAEVEQGQRGLALDAPRAAQPLDADDLIRVLEFPRDATDAAGFDLLRRALHDPGTADLIRSAEAVLSGLADDGIDLRALVPDRARPEVWRAFAQGARGPGVADLGGLRDRALMAQAAARMRADPAFREAAHRFLRGFDRRLATFEKVASDAQIARLADTRSARAFMILGRAAGLFG